MSRQQQGISVYYAISDPVIFELCELVCDRIGNQIQKRAKEFEQIKAFSTLFLASFASPAFTHHC
ncbi:hypothetical protein [Nostoc sp. FACHB-892]|uniref:hypothetical protein n=1 Tax=Nostoc sp. FACHB-892 TaxID=2692843 RepID=UPI0018EF8B5C|nr:hypothetical protein [Nostoc sp. FACHB-892]